MTQPNLSGKQVVVYRLFSLIYSLQAEFNYQSQKLPKHSIVYLESGWHSEADGKRSQVQVHKTARCPAAWHGSPIKSSRVCVAGRFGSFSELLEKSHSFIALCTCLLKQRLTYYTYLGALLVLLF